MEDLLFLFLVPEERCALNRFPSDQELDKLIPRVLLLKVQGQSMKTRMCVKASGVMPS